MNPEIDWSKPQRQSPAALVLLLYRVLQSLFRFLWPLFLLWILRKKSANSNNDNYEIIILIVSVLSLVYSALEYFNFRFSISGNQLIIKKGVFTKQNIVLPFEKIQAIHIDQEWLHSLLNVSKLSFDTAGSEKMEIKIEALDKKRSTALKEFILGQRAEAGLTDTPVLIPVEKIIFTLSGKDLFKLSISANHIEALFLMLTFIVSTLDNAGLTDSAYSGATNWVRNNFSVEGFNLVIFLAIAALLVSVAISVIRVMLTYMDFSITELESGYRIRSGLIHKKEKFIPFKRIQFVSWKSNWIRQKMDLHLFRFHATGSEKMENKMKVNVPVTRSSFLPVLVEQYHPLVPEDHFEPFRINRSYVWRRWLFVGVIPAMIAGVLLYFSGRNYEWIMIVWVVLILAHFWLYRRKFRMWPSTEAFQVKKGALGTQFILLTWSKIQSVGLEQNLYQQKKGLANLVFQTAGGEVRVPYIALLKAQQIRDYALYKIETSEWS